MQTDLSHILALGTAAFDVAAGPRLRIRDEHQLRAEVIDRLAYMAVFGDDQARAAARWAIWTLAAQMGIYPDSLHNLYMARAAGDIPASFSVPALNLRTMTFDMARAALTAACSLRVGVLCFELSRAEMAQTDQRPAEYIAVILAAAIKTAATGPVFVQVDHLRIDPRRYAQDTAAEMQVLRDLALEALQAGFYNFDLDTSTVVDLSAESPSTQQQRCVEQAAALTVFLRQHQPAVLDVSVGGEIGDMSGYNSTEAELRTFLEGFHAHLPDGMAGLSKIAVQTGVTRGGVVLPDGTVAQVPLNFETMLRLSRVAREYGLAGIVQHGASTLPEAAFHTFVEHEVAEVHLATGFQNVFFEHNALPADIRRAMYDYCETNCAHVRTPGMTDEQFYYRARRHVFGAFKQLLWDLDAQLRGHIRDDWQQQFRFLFEQFGVLDTANLARRYSQHQPIYRHPSDFGFTGTTP